MLNDLNHVNNFDSIVMLTWSNWFTELRSNRYHYASRFAKSWPVLFVQPDLDHQGYEFESTEITNVTVLHVYKHYDTTQADLLSAAMVEQGCFRPIFWIYNGNFKNIISKLYSVLNVYHGTEDYLASDSRLKISDTRLLNSLNTILEESHLLIAVSEGVADSFKQHSRFNGKMLTVTNGCDYKFYAPPCLNTHLTSVSKDIVFYQGNIFDKLDYDLLINLAKRLVNWQFVFCGKVLFNEKGWQELSALPNVEYLGLLTSEEIRAQAYNSTVGIIPFVENEWLIDRSFPLKTFEYLACGLPVVSVPIKAILQYEAVIQFASGADAFEQAIIKAKTLRTSKPWLESALTMASQQDYDLRVEVVQSEMHSLAQELANKNTNDALDIGIFYAPGTAYPGEFLQLVTRNAHHNVFFVAVRNEADLKNHLKLFNIVIIDYSSGILNPDTISSGFGALLKSSGKYKILLARDVVQNTDELAMVIKKNGIQSVCTLFSLEEMDYYSIQKNLPFMQFIHVAGNKKENSSCGYFFDNFDRFLAKEIRLPKNKVQLISTVIGVREESGFDINYPHQFLLAPSKQLYTSEDWNCSKQVNSDFNIKELQYMLLRLYKSLIAKAVQRGYIKIPVSVRQVCKSLVPGFIKRRIIGFLQKSLVKV